jgi:hypothetical protein
MKNIYKIISVLSFLFFCFSCHNTSKQYIENQDNSHIKTILIPEVQAAETINIIDQLESIILEEKENSYFGYVTKLRVFQDKIYVFDGRYAKSVFIYTLDGKHIATIGNQRGNGPLDFVSVSNFEIDYVNKKLIVMDNFGQKFMIYGLDGNFIERVGSKISITDAVLLPNNNFIHAKARYSYRISGQSNNCIFVTDKNNNMIKEGFAHDDNKNLKIHSYGIINALPNGEINFAPMFRDTIYRLSFDSISPKYAIDYGKNKKILKSQIDKLQSPNELFQLIEDGGMCFIGDNVESEDFLYLFIGYWMNPVSVFYNKRNNNTIAVSHKNDIYFDLYSVLCSDNEGYFFGAFNNNEIDELISLFPNLKELEDKTDLNPILFKYKIKTD